MKPFSYYFKYCQKTTQDPQHEQNKNEAGTADPLETLPSKKSAEADKEEVRLIDRFSMSITDDEFLDLTERY